jgi:hypothetical protein
MPELYELKLPKQGMDIILAGLAELPYKASGALIEECMKQWTQQERDEQQAADTARIEQAKELDKLTQ